MFQRTLCGGKCPSYGASARKDAKNLSLPQLSMEVSVVEDSRFASKPYTPQTCKDNTLP